MSAWRIAGPVTLLLGFWLEHAVAQTPDLEPGVQTSPAPAAAASQPGPNVSTGAAARKARPAAPSSTAPSSHPIPSAGPGPGADTNGSASTAAAGATATGKGGSKSQDRIELDTTQISGNRELPKVMYVVPWRKADLGEFAGRPPNSLLDEALTPVDRDVFRRQNRYFAALQAGSGDAKSQPGVNGGNGAGPESKDEK